MWSTDSKYLVLPSGELHIKDVGPEDGYKSYQCRTKHRLTGETRLSATKGRLVITGECHLELMLLFFVNSFKYATWKPSILNRESLI